MVWNRHSLRLIWLPRPCICLTHVQRSVPFIPHLQASNTDGFSFQGERDSFPSRDNLPAGQVPRVVRLLRPHSSPLAYADIWFQIGHVFDPKSTQVMPKFCNSLGGYTSRMAHRPKIRSWLSNASQKASKPVSSLAVDTCSVVMVLIVLSNF